MYVVTWSVVLGVTATFLPAATFTAPAAKSLTAFLPLSLRLPKSLFAALSIALRVASFKPNVTLPSSPAMISIPAFTDSAVLAVPSP